LFEINEAANLVAEAAHNEANIIFGAVIDDALGDEVRVTVIAAGFDGGAPQRSEIGTVRRPQPGIPTPPPRPDDGEAAVVSDGAAGTTGADGDTDARGGG